MEQSNEPQPLHDNSSLSFEITDVEGECQNHSNLLDAEAICQAKESERWQYFVQKKLDKLEMEKVELLCQKLDADGKKEEAENKLKTEQENNKCNLQKAEQCIKEMIHDKEQKHDKLKVELVQLESELQRKQDLCDSLSDKFKFKIKLPQKDVKFVKSKQNVPVDQETDEFLYTKGIYTVIPKMSVLLQNGQALITFEEEQVARRIQRIGRHHVDLQCEEIQVNAHPVKLDATQHFEIHLDISMKKVRVSEIPAIIPEEQMRDKLEISFSKPSLGGGEVESINYSISSGTAEITFVDKWVAQRITEMKEYPLLINGQVTCMLTVEPVMNSYLQKFQIFNGVCKRTLLLSDIKSTMEEEELQDKLKIHFQKPSKQGGEVEDINYVPKDKYLLLCFEEDSSEK